MCVFVSSPEVINVHHNLCMIMQINVLGLCVMTREFIKQLRERGVDDGHVILLNRFVCCVTCKILMTEIVYI